MIVITSLFFPNWYSEELIRVPAKTQFQVLSPPVKYFPTRPTSSRFHSQSRGYRSTKLTLFSRKLIGFLSLPLPLEERLGREKKSSHITGMNLAAGIKARPGEHVGIRWLQRCLSGAFPLRLFSIPPLKAVLLLPPERLGCLLRQSSSKCGP